MLEPAFGRVLNSKPVVLLPGKRWVFAPSTPFGLTPTARAAQIVP